MLLAPFFVLTGLGFGAWLLGHYFGFTGIAAIGAVVVIGVGGAVVLSGLLVQTGEVVERDYTTINNSTVETNTTVSFSYEQHALAQQLGGSVNLGGLQMIAGGLLLIQHLNNRSNL